MIVGTLARTRGRSFIGGFLISLVFSPLIGGLLILALPNKRPAQMIVHVHATEIAPGSFVEQAHQETRRDPAPKLILLGILIGFAVTIYALNRL